jgi:hypothetical protein
MRIGNEDMPMHWLSMSGGSEDVRFFVLDGETDKGKGSKTFFSGEMSCMEGEKVKGICIRVDPWFPGVERSLSRSFFFWCSWDNVR